MKQTQIQTDLEEIKALLKSQAEKPLSLEETSDYLHISKSYLYKLTCLKKIPYFKPNGKMIYFKKSDLNKWLFRNRQSTETELEAEATKRLNQI